MKLVVYCAGACLSEDESEDMHRVVFDSFRRLDCFTDILVGNCACRQRIESLVFFTTLVNHNQT